MLPLLRLPTFWTILLDCVAWAFLQTSIGWLSMQLPKSLFHPSGYIFRIRKWEENHQIYQGWFRVKRWKTALPSAGAVLPGGFDMRDLKDRSKPTLERWLVETCRSEFTHWLAILPAFLFFLWNLPWVGWLMIVYAVSFNVPLIIVQRYNRMRLQQILHRFFSDRNLTYASF